MLSVDDINKLEAKIEELKAENERLKHSEKDLSRICQGFKRDIETEKSSKIKYYKTLQEIKKYCEKCKGCIEVGDEVILYTIIQKIEKVEDNQ